MFSLHQLIRFICAQVTKTVAKKRVVYDIFYILCQNVIFT